MARKFQRPDTPVLSAPPEVSRPGGDTGAATPTVVAAATVDVAPLPPAGLPVTRDTPFRATGTIPAAKWAEVFASTGSRVDADTINLMWRAADGYEAEILERLLRESACASASLPAPNNCLGLRLPNGSLDFMAFASLPECVKELRRRWSDSSYKGGVYMPRELSIAGMLAKYSPPNENDTERLIRQNVDDINAWRGAGAPGSAGISFGIHPWPRGFDRRLLDLAPNGQGWDALGPRAAGMALTVCHHTADPSNADTRDTTYRLFSRGGGRWGQAATDAVIDRNGQGYLMLDPWSSDPDEGSGVTPWASGPATALKGIGIAIVQKLGANAVNKRGFSCEHTHGSGRFADALLALSVAVYGNVITRMEIPYDQYPFNPKVGLQVNAYHRNFAPTTCPSDEWVNSVHAEWTKGVILEAKKLQTGSGAGGPIIIPDPEPAPDPATYTAFGLPREQMDLLFGTMSRVDEDGTVTELEFNPEGVLSQLWLQRFGPLGIFPEAEEMHVFDSQLGPGKEWFATWEGGYTAWLPIDNMRAGWRWLDQTPAVSK